MNTSVFFTWQFNCTSVNRKRSSYMFITGRKTTYLFDFLVTFRKHSIVYAIGVLLRLCLKDYVSQRSQSVYVIIRNSISNSKCVNAGVPQGSVLGPFLFLIFINDLADDLHSISRLFADDISLSYSSTIQNEIENVLNKIYKFYTIGLKNG